MGLIINFPFLLNRNTAKKSLVSLSLDMQEEKEVEGQNLSTLDGVILSETAKTSALEKGVGVVVGDYFVGVSVNTEVISDHQEIIY
jgi:hypothetical protein